MSINLLSHINKIKDPRIPGMVTYPLSEVILTVLIGTMCRGDDMDEIEFICTEDIDWMRKICPFENGIAPAQTLRRVLQMVNPQALEQAFAQWVQSLGNTLSGVVAIDGKSLRGSGSGRGDMVHLVSAYAHAAGLILGGVAVDQKTNEIKAIPEVLKMLELQGAIVTIDAMGCQKDIAAAILHKGADYLLAVKGNQGTLHQDLVDFFADPILLKECQTAVSHDVGHGRIEKRTARVARAGSIQMLHPEWKNLTLIVAIEAVRTHKKTGKTSQETRFYIASLPQDPDQILAATRAHWGIENNLHWQLDVTFKEDHSTLKKDHTARNMSWIRRIVFNLFKRDPSALSLKRKRLKALSDHAYRNSILGVNNL